MHSHGVVVPLDISQWTQLGILLVVICKAINRHATVRFVLSQVTSIFSATIPDTVETLARTFLKDPVRVTVGERNATASNIRQQLQFAGSEEGKVLLLQQLLTEGMKAPVLIFVASKEKAILLQRYSIAL